MDSSLITLFWLKELMLDSKECMIKALHIKNRSVLLQLLGSVSHWNMEIICLTDSPSREESEFQRNKFSLTHNGFRKDYLTNKIALLQLIRKILIWIDIVYIFFHMMFAAHTSEKLLTNQLLIKISKNVSSLVVELEVINYQALLLSQLKNFATLMIRTWEIMYL